MKKVKDVAILPDMVYSYRTIKAPVECMIKEKGSKFIAFAFAVYTEDEVKNELQTLRKKYFDATHHCYAFMLGPEKKTYRAADDGEPNHSAGTPILNQIKSKDLTNILIVVVRYFGGTKLGVSGLVQAYKSSAEEVLKLAEIIEVEIDSSFLLKYDFNYTPHVMRLVKEFDLIIESEEYTSTACLGVNVRLRLKEKFIEKLELLAAMGIAVKFEELATAF